MTRYTIDLQPLFNDMIIVPTEKKTITKKKKKKSELDTVLEKNKCSRPESETEIIVVSTKALQFPA